MSRIDSDDPNLLQALAAVFVHGDPRSDRFTAQMARQALLFPVEYHLSETYFLALGNAAQEVGDADAFFGWADGAAGEVAEVQRIDMVFSQYMSAASHPIQAFLVSPRGRWGVRTTDERVALVGGDEAFVEALFALLDEPEVEHIRRFAEYVDEELSEGGADHDRARGLLRSVADD